MTEEPASGGSTDAFRIDEWPTREFDPNGRATVHGGVRFELRPTAERVEVAEAVDAALADDRFTAGSWFDLPQPVYLVHDTAVGTVFRVVVGANHVGLDVLPTTDPRGLSAFHRRLTAVSGAAWTIDRRELD